MTSSSQILVSLAAIFWMSRNAPPARCVTSKKTAARETSQIPAKPKFFRLSFRHVASLTAMIMFSSFVFLIPRFKYMKFIYSSFRLHLSLVYYQQLKTNSQLAY